MGFDFDTKDTAMPLLLLKLSRYSQTTEHTLRLGSFVSVLPIGLTPSSLLEDIFLVTLALGRD